ncbi:MAG: polysaccharide deacetylase family protein [Ktedonobacteraceae bacterium]
MRKYMLIFIAACFYFSGLVKLARWRTQRRAKSSQYLILLNYHCATGGDLRRHMLYLRRHYRLLHLEAALEELYTPHKNERYRRKNGTPLVLTFDDGYRDNYSHGFALARELQIPITIFLIPGYIESGDYFWWGEHQRLIHFAQVEVITLSGRIYHLDQHRERITLSREIDNQLRFASSVSEREAFLQTIRKKLAVPSSAVLNRETTLSLTWTEIKEMEKSGWVSFGAHTQHHPILSYLVDPTELYQEVENCRKIIEQHLGHPVRTFAYPVGQMQHIGDDVLQSVKDAGYQWAMTTQYGYNSPQSDPYLLRRIEVDVSQHWLVLAAEAAGLWGWFSRMRWIPFIRKYFTNASA